MKLLRYVGFLLALFGAAGFATSVQAAREADPNAKDLILKGDAKCTGCHDEADEPQQTMLQLHPSVLAIAKSKHGVKADGRTPTCINCHGESLDHLNYKGKDKPPKPDRIFTKNSPTPAEIRNEACSSCHDKDAGRMHWAGSQHEKNDVACTSCHQIHTQHDKVRSKRTQAEVCFSCHKTERAQTHRISTHPLDAGKMSCSDCHNPHGSVGPKLMTKESVRDTCFTCHAEKRGPFLYEHASAMDDCMNCHTPHGSTNTPLLKARSPWLCQECHGGMAPHPGGVYSAAGLPGGAVATANRGSNNAGAGTKFFNPINPITGAPMSANAPQAQLPFRGCVNCHTQIHGSNHPGGERFVR